MDDPIDLINEYIVTNHNNEITAAVLNPVLQSIVLEYRDFIGDLNLLTTPVTDDIVGAINSLQEQINDFDYTGVQVYSGLDDPNTTPPLTYAVADFYNQVDGGGDTVALWQYNGTEWVNLGTTDVGTLQEVTNEGSITTNPIIIGTTLDNITYESERIIRKVGANQTRITFDDPTGNYSANIRELSQDEEVAFLSEVTGVATTFGLIVTVANTIQDNRLIGLDTTDTDFPFSISADSSTWTEFDTDIFPDLEYDDTTGTITGFLIEVGKKVFITVIK